MTRKYNTKSERNQGKRSTHESKQGTETRQRRRDDESGIWEGHTNEAKKIMRSTE